MPHGGPTPDRVKSTMKRLGLQGVNKPKASTQGGHSHVVMAHYGSEYKLIRFGQAGKKVVLMAQNVTKHLKQDTQKILKKVLVRQRTGQIR